MALNPRFAGARYVAGASPKALHTLEFFLDYVCPFSAKQYLTLYNTVLPLLERKYPNKIQLIFRHQIQPWHPTSTLVHEASAAVLRVAPTKFWDFSARLFEAQREYFDEAVVAEGKNETYKRLAKLAGSVGVDEGKVWELLEIKRGEGQNKGNGVTADVKEFVKYTRRVGVHVSPTVLFDGVEAGQISSSFSEEQWDEWLGKNVGEGEEDTAKI